MKKILCFSDSNGFGYNPENGERFDETNRWCAILKNKLKNYYIEIDAINNRKCFCPAENEELTGILAIEKHLKEEYDYIIFALGINDLQYIYNISLEDFESGLSQTISKIKKTNSKIILLSPSNLKKSVCSHHIFKNLFDINSIHKSKKLFQIYEKISKKYDTYLINLNEIAQTSDIDGLHYESFEHKKIANYLENFINQH